MFVALLAIVMDPETLPVVFGANAAVNVVLCPGASVVLPLMPDALIPVPVTESPDIVNGELPLFVSVTALEAVEFTAMLPNATFVGDTPNKRVAVTPVPLTATVNGLFVAVEVTVTVPAMVPALLGRNATVNRAVPPAAIEAGVARPLTETPVPVAFKLETETAADPVFASWMVCVFCAPTGTFPNCAASGVALIVPALPLLPVVLP